MGSASLSPGWPSLAAVETHLSAAAVCAVRVGGVQSCPASPGCCVRLQTPQNLRPTRWATCCSPALRPESYACTPQLLMPAACLMQLEALGSCRVEGSTLVVVGSTVQHGADRVPAKGREALNGPSRRGGITLQGKKAERWVLERVTMHCSHR